ncbi:MAG: hypothetical protein VW274_04630 [Thalassolituus sp.]
MQTKILKHPLPAVIQYIRIALKNPGKPKHELICEERARVVRNGVSINPQELEEYRRQCGFQKSCYVPFTYPFLMAFPLQSDLFLSDAYPYAVMGLVHIRNVVTQHKQIPEDAVLDMDCTLIGPEKVYHGELFTFYTRMFIKGELVWECRTVLLKRGKKNPELEKSETLDIVENPQRIVDWEVPALTGVKYALLGLSLNPIHLLPFTARAFGFKRPSAHGMWAKARAMASIEPHLKGRPAEVTVDFKLPIFLPGKARLGFSVEKDEINFGLTDPEEGKPYLAGQVKYL